MIDEPLFEEGCDPIRAVDIKINNHIRESGHHLLMLGCVMNSHFVPIIKH